MKRSVGLGLRGVVVGACLMVMAACGSATIPSPSSTIPSATFAPTVTASTSVQTGGVRTVLSPLGLNLRASASTSAQILGTAAQGTVLTVSDFKAADSGWYKVQGATVTGWISADASLSAPGHFTAYI